MPPSLRSAPRKTARATKSDEGLAAQASQANRWPPARKPVMQPQSRPSIADDVVNVAASQTEQTSGLRAIRLRLNLGGGIRKTSPVWRSYSATPNRPPPSIQAQAQSISFTSLTESPSSSSRDPVQPITPLWKKSLSPLSSYIDPDEHRVPAPQEEE